jgi:hypothetical protein
MAEKYPGIPAISTQIPREISSVLAPIKEIVQAFVDGNLPQKGILNGLRTVGYVDGAGRPSVPPGAIVVDNTPPPAPTGLEAGGAIANVILSWDEVPVEIRPRIAYVEIWRAQTNDISVAQIVGQSTASVYVDAIGAAATRYYWIRFISPAGIAGPFNGQAGTLGQTSTDPNVLIDLLVSAGNSGVFYKNEDPNLAINGVPVPVGVYMRDTYIANGTISNAKIATAAIDNAKIASLDAGKITTGTISADRIDVNAIKAAIGTFTEANIGNASIGYAKLYGDMYSDNWNSSGGSAGWYLSRGGDFYAQNGHFQGSINATSGSFTGDVHAANLYGNVVGAGNIQQNAVSDAYAFGDIGENATWAYFDIAGSDATVVLSAFTQGNYYLIENPAEGQTTYTQGVAYNTVELLRSDGASMGSLVAVGAYSSRAFRVAAGYRYTVIPRGSTSGGIALGVYALIVRK